MNTVQSLKFSNYCTAPSVYLCISELLYLSIIKIVVKINMIILQRLQCNMPVYKTREVHDHKHCGATVSIRTTLQRDCISLNHLTDYFTRKDLVHQKISELELTYGTLIQFFLLKGSSLYYISKKH